MANRFVRVYVIFRRIALFQRVIRFHRPNHAVQLDVDVAADQHWL